MENKAQVTKTSYEEKAQHLITAVNIAIKAFDLFPPQGWDKVQLDHFKSFYLDIKHDAENPKKEYKNLRSLKYLENAALTYFQEATGGNIDFFWSELNKTSSVYKRENRLLKIIKRQKIRNDIEYDIVVDTIMPYQQEGLITVDDVELLEKMMAQFVDVASRKKNNTL